MDWNWQLLLGVWLIVLAMRPAAKLDEYDSWTEKIIVSAVHAVVDVLVVAPTAIISWIGLMICLDAIGL